MIPKHEIADLRELQVPVEPIPLSVGVSPETVQPNNDYNGYRVKSDDSPKIYLVMFGYRRWILSPRDYNNLFRDWNGVLRFPNQRALDASIPETSSLTPGVLLAKGAQSAPIYLVTDNVRMWVTSPQVMDKYYFAWNRVVVVPDNLVTSIPLGQNLY